ncbi:hypothetical protein Q1695_005424 [Nippostrongylus brasiliensis]|nr:hypothetical protein Q1695_005424 [Nippostrongylus brasiliensis]
MDVRDMYRSLFNKWIIANESDADIPSVSEMLESFAGVHLIVLYISMPICIVICVLGLVHVYYISRHSTNDDVRADLFYIVAIPPIAAVGALMGMFIPRAAGFLYAVVTTYYMLALYMAVDMMYTMYGGRKALARYLEKKQVMIKLSIKPYACCCTCLPETKATMNNINWIDACILQTVIIRVLLQVCELTAYFELRHKDHVFFTLSNVVNTVSMYTSLYFGYVLVEMAQEALSPYRFGLLFRLQDYIMSLPTVLKLILDFAVAAHWIGSVRKVPADSVAMYYFNFMCLLENLKRKWGREQLRNTALSTVTMLPVDRRRI